MEVSWFTLLVCLKKFKDLPQKILKNNSFKIFVEKDFSV